MNCEDTFKHIISYLNNYDIIKMELLSKNIKKFIRKNIEFEHIDCSINESYNLVKMYNKLKINLVTHEHLYTFEELNYIKNNIVEFSWCENSSPLIIDMKNLEFLYIYVTQLDKITIQLKKLKCVYIVNNDKSQHNLEFDSLKNLNGIESLSLDSNISISLSSSNFKNLKELCLQYENSIKNEHLENLINLQVLKIYHSYYITDEAFKNLNKIKTLILHNTKITSKVLQYLSNIECWSPDYVKKSDNVNENMKNIKKLKLLDLSGNSNYDDESIKNVEINHVILSGESMITINGLKNVKKMDLVSDNITIIDEDLKNLDLIYLNLNGNKIISDKGLKYCKNLKMLSLYHCDGITDEGLINMINLEYLNLKMSFLYSYDRNNKITNKSLKELIKLKYLNLNGNINITDDGIKSLINLEYLNISHNNKITINGLLNLKKLKEISCEHSLLSKKDLYILLKNNRNMKVIYPFFAISPRELPAIFYTKGTYFEDNNDEFMCYFCKNYW